MRGPTDRDIARLAAHLDDTDWRRLGTRLTHAARRNRTATTGPDGYPTSSGNGNGSSGISNPTLNAALAPTERDPLNENVHTAWRALQDAHTALNRLRDRLTRIDQDTTPADLNPRPGCEALARVDAWEPIHCRIELDGKEWALSKWAYDFTRRNGRLPTRDECQRRKEGRRVRVPA